MLFRSPVAAFTKNHREVPRAIRRPWQNTSKSRSPCLRHGDLPGMWGAGVLLGMDGSLCWGVLRENYYDDRTQNHSDTDWNERSSYTQIRGLIGQSRFEGDKEVSSGTF